MEMEQQILRLRKGAVREKFWQNHRYGASHGMWMGVPRNLTGHWTERKFLPKKDIIEIVKQLFPVRISATVEAE